MVPSVTVRVKGVECADVIYSRVLSTPFVTVVDNAALKTYTTLVEERQDPAPHLRIFDAKPEDEALPHMLADSFGFYVRPSKALDLELVPVDGGETKTCRVAITDDDDVSLGYGNLFYDVAATLYRMLEIDQSS
jgi:hypothetical protein